jgi:hypothetical protein
MGVELDSIFPALIAAGPELALISVMLWLYRTRERVHEKERDYLTRTRAQLMAERTKLIEERNEAIEYERERRIADTSYLQDEITKLHGELARTQRSAQAERLKRQEAEDRLLREKRRHDAGETAS